MVPTLVELEALPLKVNGKIDRQSLPTPQLGMWSSDRYEAARTRTEETLVSVWQRLLNVERVGVHDDFFGLGGHSLLAMRLVAQLREALDVELPVRALFEASSVARLAERIELLHWAGDELVPAQDGTRPSRERQVIA
jgi:acyl carrier protein